MDITNLLKSQISLTEWFEAIKHDQTALFREEDTKRKDRLEILKQVIGTAYDAPTTFPAPEVVNQTKKFQSFLKVHGRETCALRLNPTDPVLPKPRVRGKTILESLGWLKEQNIDPAKYQIDFIPHSNHPLWSTIFVVNHQGIFGEIIKGGHYQLTQGFHDSGKPIPFQFKFSDKKMALNKELTGVLKQIKVTSKAKQQKLTKLLQASFAHNYLCGYFETLRTKEFGQWFIDYNRALGQLYNDFVPVTANTRALLHGQIGCQGKVQGKVKIVPTENFSNSDFLENEILVCEMTTPNHLPLMAKCAAIVTDCGGILSHAAIISRELKKPCIVATYEATKVLKNGDLIEVDAYSGNITLINYD